MRKITLETMKKELNEDESNDDPLSIQEEIAMLNEITIIVNIFYRLSNIFTLLANIFTLLANIFTLLANIFTLLANIFTILANIFRGERLGCSFCDRTPKIMLLLHTKYHLIKLNCFVLFINHIF